VNINLENTTILLDVGAGNICCAIAEACLREGANVVVLAGENGDWSDVRDNMAKSHRLRMRGVNGELASIDAANAMMDDVERWAQPVSAFVTRWHDVVGKLPLRTSGRPEVITRALIARTDIRTSILFLDPETQWDDRDATESTDRCILEDFVKRWSGLAGGGRRINLICLGGNIEEHQCIENNIVTILGWNTNSKIAEEHLGMIVAFVLSPAAGLFSDCVLPFMGAGVLVI
jgi:hypothetical protein